MKKITVYNLLLEKIVAEAPEVEDELATDWESNTCVEYVWGRPARECPKIEEYAEILWIEDFEVEVEPEHERAVVEYDLDGNVVMEDYEYTDLDGNTYTGQRAVVIGSETVPATFETWVRLKPEYEITITDITIEHDLKNKLERKIATGKAIQDASEKLIHLITGDNMESFRTAEQIAQMQTDFAVINALIKNGQLISAKPMIEAIDNEDYAELKSDILALYAMSGF